MPNEHKIEVVIEGKNNVKQATEGAKKSLNELGKSAEGVASSFKGTDIAVGVAVGSIAGNIAMYITSKAMEGIKALTSGALQTSQAWARAVNDIDDKTGMLDESASRILGVAKIVGVSADDMGQALMIMSKNVQSNADVFAKWGIAIHDVNGNLLSAEQIYNNVLIRHREMANGIEKNALEMEIFGRSGGKFNDLLNLSDETMKEWNRTLAENGMILRDNVSQAMEDTEQKGRLLDTAFEGLQIQIGQALNPALDTLYDGLLNNSRAMHEGSDYSENFKVALAGLRDFAIECANAFNSLLGAIGGAINKLMEFHKAFREIAPNYAGNPLFKSVLFGFGGGEFVDTEGRSREYDFNPNNMSNYQFGGTSGGYSAPIKTSGTSGAGKSIEKVVDKTKELQATLKAVDNMELNLMKKLGMDDEVQQKQFDAMQDQIAQWQSLGVNVDNVQKLLDKARAKTTTTTQDFSFSWTDALKSCEGAFQQFGNDILTAGKSISQSLKDLFKNLANSLLSAGMGKAMNGLMSNLGIGKDADGGIASGWTLVGEKGAELVNFSNPARVYTAQQTSAMLNGNGNGDVRVIIENRSGQSVKATSSTASFDAQGMILNVVLEASANNTDGFGMALGGALSSWQR